MKMLVLGLVCILVSTASYADTVSSKVSVEYFGGAELLRIHTVGYNGDGIAVNAPMVINGFLTGKVKRTVMNNIKTVTGDSVACYHAVQGESEFVSFEDGCHTTLLSSGNLDPNSVIFPVVPGTRSEGTISVAKTSVRNEGVATPYLVVTITGDAAKALKAFIKRNKIGSDSQFSCKSGLNHVCTTYLDIDGYAMSELPK